MSWPQFIGLVLAPFAAGWTLRRVVRWHRDQAEGEEWRLKFATRQTSKRLEEWQEEKRRRRGNL